MPPIPKGQIRPIRINHLMPRTILPLPALTHLREPHPIKLGRINEILLVEVDSRRGDEDESALWEVGAVGECEAGGVDDGAAHRDYGPLVRKDDGWTGKGKDGRTRPQITDPLTLPNKTIHLPHHIHRRLRPPHLFRHLLDLLQHRLDTLGVRGKVEEDVCESLMRHTVRVTFTRRGEKRMKGGP